MPRFAIRLAVLLGLRAAPAPVVEPPRIHRDERELCAGTARIGVVTVPVAKLSAEEAYRCFGVRQERRSPNGSRLTWGAAADDTLQRYCTRFTFADEIEA